MINLGRLRALTELCQADIGRLAEDLLPQMKPWGIFSPRDRPGN